MSYCRSRRHDLHKASQHAQRRRRMDRWRRIVQALNPFKLPDLEGDLT